MKEERYVFATSKKEIEAMIKQQKQYRKNVGKVAALNGFFVAYGIAAQVLLILKDNPAKFFAGFMTGFAIAQLIKNIREYCRMGKVLKFSQFRLFMKEKEIELTGEDSCDPGDEIFGEKIPESSYDNVKYI